MKKYIPVVLLTIIVLKIIFSVQYAYMLQNSEKGLSDFFTLLFFGYLVILVLVAKKIKIGYIAAIIVSIIDLSHSFFTGRAILVSILINLLLIYLSYSNFQHRNLKS